MKRLLTILGLCLVLAVPTFGVLRTSVGTGAWNTAGTWDTGVPANGDTVVVAAGHTVTFDADHATAGIDLAGLTINGILQASTSAGAYYLKCSADITFGANGKLNAGTAGVPYPSTCTFTLDFDGTASSLECSANTGNVNLYCTQPTNKYILLSGAEAAGQTELSVATDVTGDIWAAGDTVRIDDVGGDADSEERTIAVGGIAANAITVTAALTNAKNTGAWVILCKRNVRIIGSTDYAVKDGVSCVIGAEIDCTNGVYYGSGHTVSGTVSGCTNGVYYGSGHTISGTVSGCTSGVSYGFGHTISRTVSGCDYGVIYGSGHTISGTVSGCDYGVSYGFGHTISGTVSGCTSGVIYGSGHTISGTVSGCTYGVLYGSGHTLAAASMSNTTDMYRVMQLTAYSTAWGGTTENGGYNTDYCPAWSYVASYDHDATANAFKSWTRGGITLSETSTIPSGFTQGYKLTCEDASFAGFHQESAVIMPGQTLRVVGYIKIADDHSAYAPRLEIIDCGSDPLVDAANTPLATDSVAEPGGSVDWQVVAVTYQNTGSIPMPVYIRTLAKRASGDVYFAWTSTPAARSAGANLNGALQ